jgi:hypothetical protein
MVREVPLTSLGGLWPVCFQDAEGLQICACVPGSKPVMAHEQHLSCCCAV